MFWTVYFPMISVLSFDKAHPTLKQLIFDAKLHEAFLFATKHADEAQHGSAHETLSENLRISGDLQLMLGRFEEAEESLRKSSRLIRHAKYTLRVQSCRNTGWQAFFLNRTSTALSCFIRLLNEHDLEVDRRLEALAGAIFVLYSLGYFNEAHQYLDEMSALAEEEEKLAWQQLAYTIRADLTLQHTLRQSTKFVDHVFWHVASSNFLPQPLDNTSKADALPRLLTQRLNFLSSLRTLSHGGFNTAEQLQTHLSWAVLAELENYQQALRVEIALAALSADAARLAHSFLDFNHFGQGQSHYASLRNNAEYFYCLAKIAQQSGHLEEAMHHYARYSLLAMQSIRAVVLPPDFHPNKRARKPVLIPSDDICARLPGKYRRAYNYLLENLSRADLSVREVAAQIGITERALQLTFKTHVGLSPTEVIRRHRMEHIRQDLLNETGVSIADVAEKWGVQNRSTLVNSYRRQFHEAPSDTLLR